jgi:hypothetical protein
MSASLIVDKRRINQKPNTGTKVTQRKPPFTGRLISDVALADV